MRTKLTSKENISGAISALTSDYFKAGAVWPFLITFTLLGVVYLKVDMPMLLADRFLPGTGWIEIIIASGYAAWVYYHMKDPRHVARWRKAIWLLFTGVFFSQLLLGLVADERFLMTGELHLPVPAVILAGPLYRMQMSFMPMLFLSTVNIKQRKPGMTCTYCGECLSACHQQSIRYRFAGLSPSHARNLFLVLTISLHACFLALARI